jgi:RNA recognition motif-containing protein
VSIRLYVRLYVGNISYRATAEDLHAAFTEVATVLSVHLPVDRETGRPRGFGFVEVDSESGAEAVIQAMDGHLILGRALVVSLARPREERPDRRGAINGRDGYRDRPWPRHADRRPLRWV